MTDIVERLRGLRFVHVPVASDLIREACQEIKRLRTLATQATPSEGSVQNGCTLTDEEREAVEWCRDNIIPMSSSASAFAFIHTATLRKLLERLHA